MPITSSSLRLYLHEFFVFGLKQARACVFAGSFFLLLFLSHHITFGLPRYDFIFLGAVLIQAILVWSKLETVDELKVISVFHIIGLVLEIFKTHPSVGSWSYPEFGYLKIFDVPLYSGFMYAAVGSYLCQAWRLLRVHILHYPSVRLAGLLCLLVYLNFFTNHFIPDLRWPIAIIIAISFWKTTIEFTVTKTVRRIPMLLSFILIAFFIWVAENISTYLGAWKYPDQLTTWSVVSFHKISSWSLLVIISFILVANLKQIKSERTHE